MTTLLNKDESLIIPLRIFVVKKSLLLLEIPDCEQNEIAAKQFIENFQQLEGDNNDILVKCLTKKVK